MSDSPPTPLIFAVVTTGAVTMIRQVIEVGKPNPKTLAGIFIYGLLIFGIAEVSPELATGMALVALVTSLLVNGQVVFASLGKAIG